MATRNGNGNGSKTGANAGTPSPEVIQAALDMVNSGEVPATPAAPKANPADTEAPRSDEAKADKRFNQISDGSCVNQLMKAHGFDKAALNLECAVAIAVFMYSESGADVPTKKHVMSLYEQAGYDTEPDGEDYKTINRRVNVFAKLYDFEGISKWRNIVVEEGATEEGAIEALKNFLTQEYAFRGINDILRHIGQPVKQYNSPEERERRAEKERTRRDAESGATSTKAGGEKGDALPQGTSGEGGVDATTGQPLTKEGEIDKRTKPADGSDTSEGVKHRMENNPNPLDKLSDKAPGEIKQATAEDKAVAAKAAEQAGEGRKFGRRAADNGIVLIAGQLQLGIPYGTSGADIQAMFGKLMLLAARVKNDTVLDQSFDDFSDTPSKEKNGHVAH